MDKKISEFRSLKKDLTQRLRRAELALESAKRRHRLRLACKMHVEQDIPRVEVLKRFPGLDKSTFYRWLRTNAWNLSDEEARGGNRHLPPEAEQVLAAFVIQMAKLGSPVLRANVKSLAYEMTKDITGSYPKSQSMEGWFRNFLERHNAETFNDGSNKIKVRRKGEGLSKQRARCLNPKTVEGYANKCIQPFLDRHPELTIDHIGGQDEWMFEVEKSIRSGKVVSPAGLLYTCTPWEHDQHMTVLSGYVGTWATPLMLIFKGAETRNEWKEHVLTSRGYIMVAVSHNGWITPELKLEWYENVRNHPDFPYPDEPVFWQCDGHYTNTDYKFVMRASTWLSHKDGNYEGLFGKPISPPEFPEQENAPLPPPMDLSHLDSVVADANASAAAAVVTSEGDDVFASASTSVPDPSDTGEQAEVSHAAETDHALEEGSMDLEPIDLAVTGTEESITAITVPIALVLDDATELVEVTHTPESPSSDPSPLPKGPGKFAHLIKGDYITILPPHSTHGLQGMDSRNGPIMTAKRALGEILAQQFQAKNKLTKSDLIFCLRLAYFGGTYHRIAEGAERIVAGINAELLAATLRRVGWRKCEKNGRLLYDPMSVVDPRKFMPSGRFTIRSNTGDDLVGVSLGPTEPEPTMVVGAGRTPYYTLEEARHTQAQILAAECCKRFGPSIAPEPKKCKRGGTGATVLTMESILEDKVKADKKEAEDAAKRQIANKKQYDAMAKARDIAKGFMAQVVEKPNETVITLKVVQLESVLRIMGLPVSGQKEKKQQRIVDGMPGFKSTIESTEGGLASLM